MTKLNITVNGQHLVHEVTPRTHLGDFLRDQVRLTGTHLGCEHGVCGACVVLKDGKPVRSCITFAASCDGHHITTIEGYDADPVMARLRTAFTQHHALQCGYCTPGMLATSRDIVLRLPLADEQTIRAELSGNLCRCTGYAGIVRAILDVLDGLRVTPDQQIETLRAETLSGKIPVIRQHVSPLSEFKKFQTTQTVDTGATTQIQKQSQHEAFSKNANHIEEEFQISHPAENVWRLMIDLPAVAQCLPGAQVNSMENDCVQGTIAVKFGPMQASFDGSAVLELNNTERSAIIHGTGHDKRGNSQAKGDIGYRIQAIDEHTSRVSVTLDYALQGPLAQFSRSGLVQEFVRRMIKDFAKNISHVLDHPGGEHQLPRQATNSFIVLLSILWERFRRLFAKNR